MVLAACTVQLDGPSATGEPVTSTSLPTTTSTTLASAEAVERFRSCLSEEGVEVGEIPFDARGRPRLDLAMATIDLSDPDTASSLTECARILSQGPLGLVGEDPLHDIVLGHLEDFTRCMVSRGVEDFPDPVPGFVGIGPPFPLAEIPYADPELPAAADFCRVALIESLESLEEDL